MIETEYCLGKIAITLAVAVFMASTQCIAACGALPCDKALAHHQSASSEDCHQHQVPPAGDQHNKTSCGHQVFLSDAAVQPFALTFHHVVFDLIAIPIAESVPEALVVLEPASDRSPPPSADFAAKTILRV